MKNILRLLLMVSTLQLTAQQVTHLHFYLPDFPKGDSIGVGYTVNYIDLLREEQEISPTVKGKAELNIMLSEPREITVSIGETSLLLFLEPGDRLTCNFNPYSPLLGAIYTGSAASAAVLYTDFQSKFGTFSEQEIKTAGDFYTLSPTEFLKKQDSLLDLQLAFISARKDMVSERVYQQLSDRVWHTAFMNKLRYPTMRLYYTRKPYKVFYHELDSLNYYAFAKTYKQAQSLPKLSEPVCFALWEYNRWNYQQARNEKPYSQLDEIKQAEKQFTGAYKDLVMAFAFNMQIAGGNYPEMDSVYRYVQDQVSESAYLKIIETHYFALNTLIPGSVAPAIELMQFNGKPFRLDSLKGKTVLLEFWHSGCAPCLEGFAASNQLHSCLPDDVVMVYVCADLDSARGRAALRKHQVSGIHVHAPGFTNPVLLAYNIRAFPTLFVITPDGTIKSSNAPRPGSKELDELLNPK
ncbi:MAG: TlpA family protein disulfide reductase [Bacteroidia bacterium]|nr:TlpA family protein disulfide reductase [Bacteroidia bacterium]